MKVRFTVAVSHDGKRHDSGAVADLPEDVAKHFVGMGYAEPSGQQQRRQKQATRRAPRQATKKAAASPKK